MDENAIHKGAKALKWAASIIFGAIVEDFFIKNVPIFILLIIIGFILLIVGFVEIGLGFYRKSYNERVIEYFKNKLNYDQRNMVHLQHQDIMDMVKQEKEKINEIYKPIWIYVENYYYKHLNKCYKYPFNYHIDEDIKLLTLLSYYGDKLSKFTYTQNDNKLLDEISDLHNSMKLVFANITNLQGIRDETREIPLKIQNHFNNTQNKIRGKLEEKINEIKKL